MTEKVYELLKIELSTVENELTRVDLPYDLYMHLKKKKALLEHKIDECPLIYEIWYDDYDGSMSMQPSNHSLKFRYIDKKKAYAKLKELNDGCNYGKPYYMRIEELDG